MESWGRLRNDKPDFAALLAPGLNLAFQESEIQQDAVEYVRRLFVELQEYS